MLVILRPARLEAGFTMIQMDGARQCSFHLLSDNVLISALVFGCSPHAKMRAVTGPWLIDRCRLTVGTLLCMWPIKWQGHG